MNGIRYTQTITLTQGSTKVYEALMSVLKFWFPNKEFQEFWFSQSVDARIRIEYFDLWKYLKELTVEELNTLITGSITPVKTYLAIVICLDQFTRNLNRTSDRSQYEKTDTLCFELIKKMHDTFKTDDFPINERIFILLPFRHQRKTHLLDHVMYKIQVMETEVRDRLNTVADVTDEELKIMNNIVRRFKIATIKDYSKVTDTIKHYVNDVLHETHLLENPALLQEALDDTCIKYGFDPIAKYDASLSNTDLYKEVKKFVVDNKISNVCISLSGGVDSMALSYILVHLHAQGTVRSLCAVHVDYGNREVSRTEAMCVESWCKYFNIPLITRRIEHIKRDGATILTDAVDRALYEQETKNIRFNLYREAMRLYGSQSVMLGHHSDDLAENVLMNLLRGGDILNLFTMKQHQTIDGVPISRPMLGVSKDDIYSIAHIYRIPYLKDTTPEDCMRGKVRKTVFPALESVDSEIRKKINSSGMNSEGWKNVVEVMIIQPIISSVRRYKFGIVLPYNESYDKLNFTAWQKVLADMFHGNGVRMISNNNLKTFINWLSRKNGFMRLSNGYMASFNTENNKTCLVFVVMGMATQIQEISSIDPIKFVIPDSGVLCCTANGWTIDITRVECVDVVDNDFSDKISTENLLNGMFSFCYKTCEHSKCCAKDDTDTNGNITYALGPKESSNKRFFRGNAMAKYIPMIHLGYPCTDCKPKPVVYKIKYSYLT